MLLFAPVSFKDFSISGYAKRYLTAPTNFLSAVAVLVDRDKYKEYNYDWKNKNDQIVLEIITWRLQNRKMQ